MTLANYYNLFFLPVILSLGVLTSRQDIKTSKILNKWVVASLCYSGLIYAAAFLVLRANPSWAAGHGFAALSRDMNATLSRGVVNFTVSVVVAVWLWHYKIWGGGDAKLFLSYVALIPLPQYKKVYFDYYFASFYLLLCIFIPATVYLLLKSGIYLAGHFRVSDIADKVSSAIKKKGGVFLLHNGFIIFFGFIALFFISDIVRGIIFRFGGAHILEQNSLIILSCLVYRPLSRFFKRQYRFMFIAFAFGFLYNILLLPQHLGELLMQISRLTARCAVIMLVCNAANSIVDLYIDQAAKKTLPLAPWLFIGTLVVWFIK